jgi:cell wall-associated NlpC family hydrolase
MTTRAQIVAAARSLIGTPYHAHGRKPGVGIDCPGVPIVSCWIVRPQEWGTDVGWYGMQPDGSLMDRCDSYMTRVRKAEMRPGDMIVVRWGTRPHHMGVVGDWRHGGLSMIHAENWKHKKVVEHRLCFTDNAMEFVAAFRLPGVEA